MPQDPSRPSSWKGEDRSAMPAGRRPGQGAKYSWKTGDAKTGPPSGRKLKAGFYSFLGILVVAGLAWLAYQLRSTRATCVTVVASDPRSAADNLSLPFNIYGHRDARDFLAWANSGDRAVRKWCSLLGDKAVPWVVSKGRLEDDWVNALLEGKEDTIILYVAQPGGTDENDKPFFFDEKGGRRDVLELLQSLRSAGKKKSMNKKKFLIFDATQTPTDWHNGVMVNRFVDGLIKLESEIKADPNLLILCSSSPGQRSWVSEEFGGSIFSHFLREGLSGDANGRKSSAITPSDLLPYLRTKVNDWVQRNRADNQRPFRQEPMILPKDAETGDFAKKFVLAYGDPGYQPVMTPSKRSFKKDDLQKAWDTCEKLGNKVPNPSVYSPRGWRRYRELLLRYETALRAGDDEVAAKLSGAIASLAGRLDQERGVPAVEAISAGLAMPAALGRNEPDYESRYSEIIDGKDSIGIGLKSLAGGGDETIQRLKLIGYMLRVAADKPEKFADVIKRIGEIDDGGTSRPAEAQLAEMLAKYATLPGGQKPGSELIRLALEVRRLAERTVLSVESVDRTPGHPYSERLSRQLADDVAKADRDRRRGEDLLFAAVEPHHAEAKRLLQSAESQYQQVQKKAAPVRKALEVRDAVFADLTFLTEWASLDNSHLTDEQQRKPEALWKETHALADRVSQLDPLHESAPKINPVDKELADHAEDVLTEFKALAKTHRDIVATLAAGPESTLQSTRQQIDCVLAVPGPLFPAAERVKLVTRVREIGYKLAQEQQTGTLSKVVTEGELAKNVSKYARAIMGKTTFDGLSDADSGLKKSFELVDDPSLGMQLANYWKKLRTETDRANRTDADKTLIPLHWRERLGLLSGSSDDKQPREPALVAREERWNLAFRRLARRTEIDHWYDGNDKPYYEKIAKKFLKGLPEEEGTSLAKQLEDRRDRGKFRVQPPDERILTTEREVAPVFKFTAVDAQFDPGFAAVSPKLNAAALRLKSEPSPKPVLLDAPHDERVELVAPEFLDRLKDPQAIDLTLHGFYRGQTLTTAVAKLPIKPIPDLTVSRPPPPLTAQIAARAEDELDLGAIAIVFDCSGSMREPYDDDVSKTKIKKIDAAKSALAQFEKKLANGTLVSLWVYGHESRRTEVEQLLPLTTWDRSRPTLLSDRVEPLKESGFTPLVEAMISATSDSPFANYTGNKTLLVLTDGCDEKYKVPKSAAYDKEVSDAFTTAFVAQDRKVSIRMVMFRADDDKEHTEIQFKNLDKVRMPSSRTDATSGQMVVDLMADALRPRVTLYRGSVQVTSASFVAKRIGEPLEWFPEPPLKEGEFGEYELRCRETGQGVILDAGDRLAMRIRKSPTGLRFSRLLMADDVSTNKLRLLDGQTDDSQYALGLVNGQLFQGDGTTRGKFTLEDRRAARVDAKIMRLDRPRFTWWEMRAAGRKDIPPQSRVTMVFGMQAPTWELMSSQWPPATGGGNWLPAAVEVWVTGNEPDVVDTRELSPNERLADVAIEGNAVLESAGFEKTMMPMSDGVDRELNCLVMRVYSPTGVKYYAQVAGAPPKAEVHRYFNDAKRSTHAFWVDEGRPARIKLISIDAMKQKYPKSLKRDPVE